MFQIIFIVLAVLAASVHLAVSPTSRAGKPAIARTYLLYLLVIYVGFMGILTAYPRLPPHPDLRLHRLVHQPLRGRSPSTTKTQLAEVEPQPVAPHAAAFDSVLRH